MITPILTHFSQAGFTVTLDSKGRAYRALIRLLGDIPDLEFLREDHMIRFCTHAQIRKGAAYTLDELIAIAQPRAQMGRFLTQFHWLLDRQVFWRGYSLRCPVCDLESWVDLNMLAEHLICPGCRVAFQIPLKIDFAFKPNPLFAQTLPKVRPKAPQFIDGDERAPSACLSKNFWTAVKIF